MFVIEVIPLRRGIPIESLSYYSAASYPEGALISVPIQKKETSAIVLSVKPVSVAKAALKTATFSLRKLSVQKDVVVLPEGLLETARKISQTTPASMGAILFALLPPDIRSGERTYPKATAHKGVEDTIPNILCATTNDRYMAFKSHIRQTFAHRGSVLFIVPTSGLVEQAKKKLEIGIENRIVTFSSVHTKRQIDAAYAAFEDLRHAKLIIATPAFAFLERHDITTIIIEAAGSEHYRIRNRPYLDAREALKMYAKQTGRSIILADTVVKTEDEIKRRDDLYGTYGEPAARLDIQGVIKAVKHKKIEGDEIFSLCTDELQEEIERSLATRGQIFLHAARRGLAPAVICYDCGYIFRCPDSGAPYSLLRTYTATGEEERWFFSSTSGKRVRAADTCPQCGSWRLREHGIGIQYIYDQITKLFPKIEVFLFDHTTATTHLKAKKIIDKFYESKRSILIGTNMALPYLSKPVDLCAIISYEATRALPTWRAEETIFSLLVRLREIALKDVIVQLRTEPDELLQLASRGLIEQFYDGEIEIRKALKYPPYSVFVLLAWMGSKEQTALTEASLQKTFEAYNVQFYSAPQSSESKTVRYGLIRSDAGQWPIADLISKLQSLPPYIKIEINPDRIV